MKCEICHKAEATTVLKGGGEDDERYVCADCARAEEAEKGEDEEGAGEDGVFAPPGAPDAEENGQMRRVLDAMGGILDTVKNSIERHAAEAEDNYRELPRDKKFRDCMFNGYLHLEGLFLFGDLDRVKRALEALDMRLEHPYGDGHESGHIYRVMYRNPVKQAARVFHDMVEQERYARIALIDDDPIVFADTVMRSLGILRNARLLTAGEYADLLSPMKLAAREMLLEGISEREIDALFRRQSQIIKRGRDNAERDIDRAEEANERFARVRLAGRAKEIFG